MNLSNAGLVWSGLGLGLGGLDYNTILQSSTNFIFTQKITLFEHLF